VSFAPKLVPPNPVKDLSEIRRVPTSAELTIATEHLDCNDVLPRSLQSCNNNPQTFSQSSMQDTSNNPDFLDARDICADMDAWDDMAMLSQLVGDSSGLLENPIIPMTTYGSVGSLPLQPTDSYQWLPSSSTTSSTIQNYELQEQSQQYILGQFLPCNTKELLVPTNSSIAAGQAAEVSIRGKCCFYISNTSMLIRRMEFSYHQQSTDGKDML
jgi:hypothetical protein